MTGDIGESMIVRFEGKSRVKGNTKKFNRCRSRDNLTVIRDVLWFERLALSPFKEHPNRFGVALDDTMIGVKTGQFIQGGLKVRLDEMGIGDRTFSVDHEIVSKERSMSVRNKLGKFRHVE